MTALFNSFASDEDGATAIEFALIASIVSIIIIGVLLGLRGAVTDMFAYISSSILGAQGR